jgi:hypothetical protein
VATNPKSIYQLTRAKTRSSFASATYYKMFLFVLYFVAASASFNGYYDKWHFREGGVDGAWAPVQFDLMVDGTVARPYAYRQMLPATANWLDTIVPQAFKTWLYTPRFSYEKAFPYTLFDSSIATNPAYSFRYLVLYLLTFLFAWLAVYAMHLICKALQFPPTAAVFAPVILILLFPYILSIGGYFYDYPELALMALAAWVALKFNWWWVIPVAALGTWNKESFLLFILTLYPILRLRISRLHALFGTSFLCLVCLTVYYPIRLRFAHNPGAPLESHWLKQAMYFLHPHLFIFGTEKTYGLIVSSSCTVLPLSLIIWTAWRAWRHLPCAIKRHAKIAASINLPLFLLFCYPGELRDFSLLYIDFLVILAVNLTEWTGTSQTTAT